MTIRTGFLIGHLKDSFILVPAFAAFYALTYWTSDVFRLPETGSTPWNPEAGLAVTAFCLFGWRSLPILAASHFACLAVWAPFSSLPWTAVLAAGHMTALALFVYLQRGQFLALSLPGSSAAAHFVAAATAATAASALVQMLIAVFATDWSYGKIMRYGMTVSVGNMVGILTVVPLLLDFPRLVKIRQFFSQGRWGGFLLLLFLLATCVAVFGIAGLDQFKFFYLVFVPVIALALRNGMTGAVLAVLLASACMTAVLSLRDFNGGTVAELQFLMIVLSVTGLVLGASIDERQRMHAENVDYLNRLRESEDALMRASRISLASEMVAAVSHEIAQPLSSARSHVRALRRRLNAARRDKQKDSLDADSAVRQIDSAASTIRHMRDFLRRGDAARGPIDLEGLVRNTIDLVKPDLRRADIDLKILGMKNLPMVHGNRTQISQVLLNLVRNSRDAIAESGTAGGSIVISALAERPSFIEICVTDNGPGVDETLRPNLFTPLRSSKADGLGLGLSLSHSIIAAHGGELWHDPASREGTRFCFTLPMELAARETRERAGS